MSERWRCFVALPIGADLRASLAAAREEWRASPDLGDLRWTDPAGWHVTLAFLGLIDAASAAAAAKALRSLPPRASLRLAGGGVGGFPSSRRGRVAWYGIADPDGALSALAAEVRRAVGVPGDHPLRPHLTLARARHEVDLRDWVSRAAAPGGRLVVDRLELMRSHVGVGPARYETLASIRLGVPAHA